MCTFACNGLKARVWGRVGETYGSSLPPTGANGQHPIVHPHRRRHDCRIGANGFGRGEHNAPPGRPHQHHPQGTGSPHPQHLGNIQPHRRCPEGQHSRPGAWSGEKGEGKQSSKGKVSHTHTQLMGNHVILFLNAIFHPIVSPSHTQKMVTPNDFHALNQSAISQIL